MTVDVVLNLNLRVLLYQGGPFTFGDVKHYAAVAALC